MSLRPHHILMAFAFTTVIGLLILLCPWFIHLGALYDPFGDGMLIVVGLQGIAWCTWVVASRIRECRSESTGETENDSPAVGRIGLIEILLLAFVGGLWLALFWGRVRDPVLLADDYQYVRVASSWETTFQDLFTPFAEHYCVITRLFTCLLCTSISPPAWPRALGLSGMGLFLVSLLLFHWFVRQEFRSPTMALIASSLFGLTTVHREVIQWYSASQWCWGVLLLFASLLIIQSNRADFKGWRIVAVGILAAIAPFNYSVGFLVGPLSAIYLACHSRIDRKPLRLEYCLVPLLATLPFLLVSFLPRVAEKFTHATQGGWPVSEAIAPIRGVVYGVRSTVDLLVLRNCGAGRIIGQPTFLYAVPFLLGAYAVGELIRRTPRPCGAILGCALVIIPYAVVLPFRGWVRYEDVIDWSRYQLFPQIGVALLVCSLCATLGPDWVVAPTLSLRHAILVVACATALFMLHAFGA